MAVTLSEIEAAPASWPTVTPYAHTAPLDPDDPGVEDMAVWRRIEAWITTRWTAREVVHVVEGPGAWQARLSPFTITSTERWTGAGWEAVTLLPCPLGGAVLEGEGPYRITGNAGDDSDPPADAQEAWRRLHSFMLGNANARLDELSMHRTEGDLGGEATRGFAAKAIPLSGAGDLLRPYRRLA